MPGTEGVKGFEEGPLVSGFRGAIPKTEQGMKERVGRFEDR